jgi:DNA double-strand break repair helicase HerA and related ATPase
LLQLEAQGGDNFFGEPAVDVHDMMTIGDDGRGTVNVLAADKLMAAPKLYATFLLWLLSELFETLPEVGDPDKPKLVFFFDEAHLLFDDAAPALLDKIEQVVRLIRSKAVGVYFVTQNPLDIPETVLGQLSNRVQHALRAFTPKDQKAVKAAAETLRPNPKLNTAQVIMELEVGEALVSLLDEKGRPGMVERAFVVPPGSQLGPIDAAERRKAIESAAIFGHYEKTIDRESAYEKLKGRAVERHENTPQPQATPAQPPASTAGSILSDVMFGRTGPRGGQQSKGMVEAMASSAARAIGSELGRQVLRGVLGSILGSAKRR